MSDNPFPINTPAPARVAYTTSFLSAPQFIGFIVALILGAAQHFGLTFFDSAEMQGVLALGVGWAVGAVGSWLFPSASGRLGLTSPLAWNAPSPQDVPVGTSLVSVPAPFDQYSPTLATIVRPADDIAQTIRTAEVSAAVASAKATVVSGQATPVTVNVTPEGQDNEAVRVSAAEQRAAPSVPAGVTPTPAPRAA